MSGGSYNYLCYAQTAEELLEKKEELEWMANKLRSLDYAEAVATETSELINLIDTLKNSVERKAEYLFDVWKAVEWWESGDSGEEEVKKAALAFSIIKEKT